MAKVPDQSERNTFERLSRGKERCKMRRWRRGTDSRYLLENSGDHVTQAMI